MRKLDRSRAAFARARAAAEAKQSPRERALVDLRRAECRGADEAPEAVRPLVGADGFLRCLPHRHDTDGFTAVRIRRK